MTILPGTKKLVPATWSRKRRMQAGINTAKAVRPMQEVMNQPQVLSGKRHKLMPLVRISSVVVMKFKEPSSWPIQKIPMEAAQRTTPVPSPGPPTSPIALSGAYWVQPPRVRSESSKSRAAGQYRRSQWKPPREPHLSLHRDHQPLRSHSAERTGSSHRGSVRSEERTMTPEPGKPRR